MSPPPKKLSVWLSYGWCSYFLFCTENLLNKKQPYIKSNLIIFNSSNFIHFWKSNDIGYSINLNLTWSTF